MSAPVLTIDALNKRFGRIQALHSISLDVRDRELLVVLGPTGAGKTTLLRTLAGLEHPDSGAVHFAGQDITRWAPAERDVALVFQNFSLYPNKTVRQNLEFPLKAPGRQMAPEEIAQRIARTAEILRITPLLDRPATRLSGGEMQRVAIGRAIVRRPRLFLMDEPLTNLDAKLREGLRVELIRLQRNLGAPMIYVTHDQAEALSMADRIAVLSEGRILQIGTPEEIYRSPKSPVVARQLGYPPINLISVHRRNAAWHTRANTAIFRAKTEGPDSAVIGCRPEDIAPEGGHLPATVRVVEDMGPSTLLLAHWAGENIRLLIPGKTSWSVGDTIYPQMLSEAVTIWSG